MNRIGLTLFFLVFYAVSAKDYYWRYPHTDILDKHHFSLRSNLLQQQQKFLFTEEDKDFFPNLEILCSARAECLGFTSDGILLTNVTSTKSSASRDLYVKNSAPPPTARNIWPLPQSIMEGPSVSQLTISPNFKFTLDPSFPDLVYAVNWITSVIFPHKSKADVTGIPLLPSIVISVANPNVPLQIGVDESYTLTIPNDQSPATLKAATYYGALNGLQTLSQLVYFNFSAHVYQIEAPVTIQDFPRYSHRGLLVDTSRHFQPVPVLKLLVDSLSYAKLNVLHWHVVDSQSFPFESKSWPELWNGGSYSYYERYSQDDISEIVEYSRLRNVRVMIEFDTPGHAASWCDGYPQICPSPTCKEPLNPASEETFRLLTDLFMECTGNKVGGGLFPSSLIHLGGDEVDTSCWVKTPSIATWLKSKNFTAEDAYLYFVNRVFDTVISQSRDPVNWEEVYNHFGTKLNKKSIVHAWYNKKTVAKAVKDGYRSLNSDGWYLDHLGDLWTAYYLNDPMENIVNPTEQKLVLGGECCMWGETVDPSDIFNTIWPRAAAVAERLWSAASVVDTVSALPRYEFFRCLLTLRGINAAPANNKLARQPPPNPGSCLVQK